MCVKVFLKIFSWGLCILALQSIWNSSIVTIHMFLSKKKKIYSLGTLKFENDPKFWIMSQYDLPTALLWPVCVSPLGILYWSLLYTDQVNCFYMHSWMLKYIYDCFEFCMWNNLILGNWIHIILKLITQHYPLPQTKPAP